MDDWRAISDVEYYLTSLGFFVFLLVLYRYEGILPVLNWAEMLFHEAGHFILAVLVGGNISVYGGTLFQVGLPLLVAVKNFRERHPTGFTVGLIWFFETFLYTGIYMADARRRAIPMLIEGTNHDWRVIFSQWGLLSWDRVIGNTVWNLGWLGMISGWLLLTIIWLKQTPEVN